MEWKYYVPIYLMFSQLLTTVFSSTKWCIPGEVYKAECNRCWCVGDQITICTKINCYEIPKKFRRRLHLNDSSSQQRANGIVKVLKSVTEKFGKKFLIPALADTAKPAVDWTINQIKQPFWFG